jgi:hypothetical protein
LLSRAETWFEELTKKYMQSVPAIVQILIVFALVVFATARKIHLGLAAAMGGLELTSCCC